MCIISTKTFVALFLLFSLFNCFHLFLNLNWSKLSWVLRHSLMFITLSLFQNKPLGRKLCIQCSSRSWRCQDKSFHNIQIFLWWSPTLPCQERIQQETFHPRMTASWFFVPWWWCQWCRNSKPERKQHDHPCNPVNNQHSCHCNGDWSQIPTCRHSKRRYSALSS